MTTAHSFLSALHRDGAYSYWWTLEGHQSFWWESNQPTALPGGKRNVYFGVHPTNEIPQTDRHGKPVESRSVRSQIGSIAACSCFFADYDAKAFESKESTLAHVETLDPRPSVVVDSGGGYHCYWLFNQPIDLTTDEQRETMSKMQAAWVVLMGGDTGAKDLARVLRVPGTFNYKYDPPRPVSFVWCALDCLFDSADLFKLASPFVESAQPKQVTNGSVATDQQLQTIASKWLGNAVARVRGAPDGSKHKTLLAAAVALGGLVPLHLLTESEIESTLYAAIEGRAEDGKSAKDTIKDGIGYGVAKPWKLEDVYKSNGNAPIPSDTAMGELVAPDSFQAFLAKPVIQSGFAVPITALQLGQKEIAPTRYFIQDMLRPGLALFIGNPGIGKTPALIQLALAFATGNPWLGSIGVLKCRKVLYIGVEYDEAYIKETAIASYGSSNLPENLLFLSMETFTPPKTEEESMQMLEYYIVTYGVDVVIIDVFSGFLPREKFKQDKYRGDYAEFLMYQKLFMFHKALLVGSWHGGKHAKDPETAYNGGQGMWGSAGGGRLTMIFDDENQVRFRSQLRGHERKEWVLEQARIGGAHFWSVVDTDPDPIFGSDAQRRIFSAVKRHSTAREPLSPQGVKAILTADAPELGLKDSYIRQTLSRFEDRGILVKWNGGYIIQRGSPGSRGSDEVRGSLGSDGSPDENDPNDPNDPMRSNSAIHDIPQPDAELGRAIQAIQQNQRSNGFASDPTDFWHVVPMAQRTVIRLYLRSQKEDDQVRARELCEEYHLDYEEAKRHAST